MIHDDIKAYIKEHYPPGTQFTALETNSIQRVKKNWEPHCYSDGNADFSIPGKGYCSGYIYLNGKWASIIETKSDNTFNGFKVGEVYKHKSTGHLAYFCGLNKNNHPVFELLNSLGSNVVLLPEKWVSKASNTYYAYPGIEQNFNSTPVEYIPNKLDHTGFEIGKVYVNTVNKYLAYYCGRLSTGEAFFEATVKEVGIPLANTEHWVSKGSNTYFIGVNMDKMFDPNPIRLEPEQPVITPETPVVTKSELIPVTKYVEGLRVQRGPDWSYSDQDGGAGKLGTLSKSYSSTHVYVKWDHTGYAGYIYRVCEGKYDLALANPADAYLLEDKPEFHNLDNLTPEQVGEGYRLLYPSEVASRKDKYKSIQKWTHQKWHDLNRGNDESLTYRVPACFPKDFTEKYIKDYEKGVDVEHNPEFKFKIDDRVIIIDNNPSVIGQIGTIQSQNTYYLKLDYIISGTSFQVHKDHVIPYKKEHVPYKVNDVVNTASVSKIIIKKITWDKPSSNETATISEGKTWIYIGTNRERLAHSRITSIYEAAPEENLLEKRLEPEHEPEPKFKIGDTVQVCKLGNCNGFAYTSNNGKFFEPIQGIAEAIDKIVDSLYIKEKKEWYYELNCIPNNSFIAEHALTLQEELLQNTAPEESLLEKARRLYPIGTKYVPLNSNGSTYANAYKSQRIPGQQYNTGNIECGTGYIYISNLNKWAEIVKEEAPVNDLLEEAKRRYPVGTKYKSVIPNDREYTVDEQSFSLRNANHVWGEANKGSLYDNGKWAEIISTPEVSTELSETEMIAKLTEMYPVGTTFIPASRFAAIYGSITVKKDWFIIKSLNGYKFKNFDGSSVMSGYLYTDKGIYAEIISQAKVENASIILKENDIVVFKGPNGDREYKVYSSYLVHKGLGKDNSIIFEDLGIDSKVLAQECYGYYTSLGDWPTSKPSDYEALTRLVNKLHELCTEAIAVKLADHTLSSTLWPTKEEIKNTSTSNFITFLKKRYPIGCTFIPAGSTKYASVTVQNDWKIVSNSDNSVVWFDDELDNSAHDGFIYDESYGFAKIISTTLPDKENPETKSVLTLPERAHILMSDSRYGEVIKLLQKRFFHIRKSPKLTDTILAWSKDSYWFCITKTTTPHIDHNLVIEAMETGTVSHVEYMTKETLIEKFGDHLTLEQLELLKPLHNKDFATLSIEEKKDYLKAMYPCGTRFIPVGPQCYEEYIVGNSWDDVRFDHSGNWAWFSPSSLHKAYLWHSDYGFAKIVSPQNQEQSISDKAYELVMFDTKDNSLVVNKPKTIQDKLKEATNVLTALSKPKKSSFTPFTKTGSIHGTCNFYEEKGTVRFYNVRKPFLAPDTSDKTVKNNSIKGIFSKIKQTCKSILK